MPVVVPGVPPVPERVLAKPLRQVLCRLARAWLAPATRPERPAGRPVPLQRLALQPVPVPVPVQRLERVQQLVPARRLWPAQPEAPAQRQPVAALPVDEN